VPVPRPYCSWVGDGEVGLLNVVGEPVLPYDLGEEAAFVGARGEGSYGNSGEHGHREWCGGGVI